MEKICNCKNYRDALNIADLEGKITDYFANFDYILGDYAYGKVRLKGFNEKGNTNFKPINDYAKIDEYIKIIVLIIVDILF